MRSSLYDMIFRRKSFHTFKTIAPLSEAELAAVKQDLSDAEALFTGIRTETVIVPSAEVSGARGAEYCILFYSEKKEGWLQNIGYIGEQIDLMLTERGIGTLWLGLGKTPEKERNGLSFVIMMAFGKTAPDSFRRDVTKAARKSIADIWEGKLLPIAETVRYAPSACNSQPWKVIHQNSTLRVIRVTHRAGIIPAAMLGRMNRIDMGIFLCILDLCLAREKITFERKVFAENDSENNHVLNAEYILTERKA